MKKFILHIRMLALSWLPRKQGYSSRPKKHQGKACPWHRPAWTSPLQTRPFTPPPGVAGMSPLSALGRLLGNTVKQRTIILKLSPRPPWRKRSWEEPPRFFRADLTRPDEFVSLAILDHHFCSGRPDAKAGRCFTVRRPRLPTRRGPERAGAIRPPAGPRAPRPAPANAPGGHVAAPRPLCAPADRPAPRRPPPISARQARHTPPGGGAAPHGGAGPGNGGEWRRGGGGGGREMAASVPAAAPRSAR